jgi:hypothetical protein
MLQFCGRLKKKAKSWPDLSLMRNLSRYADFYRAVTLMNREVREEREVYRLLHNSLSLLYYLDKV